MQVSGRTSDHLAREVPPVPETGLAAAGLAYSTLERLVATPSPLERLLASPGPLAKFTNRVPSDPSPIAQRGDTIRVGDTQPDMAARVRGPAMIQTASDPTARSGEDLRTPATLAERTRVDGPAETRATGPTRDPSAVAVAHRVDGVAGDAAARSPGALRTEAR